MDKHDLTPERILAYRQYLLQEERAPATVEKYLRDIGRFARWLDGEAVSKGSAANWKAQLLAQEVPQE